MKGKPQRTQNWLPTQVLYGMDCSDPEPKNWRAFGELAEQATARAASSNLKDGGKSGLPLQSARAE